MMEQNRTNIIQSQQAISPRKETNSPTKSDQFHDGCTTSASQSANQRPDAGAILQNSKEHSGQGFETIPLQSQTKLCMLYGSVSSFPQNVVPVIQVNADNNQTSLEFMNIGTSSSNSLVGLQQNSGSGVDIAQDQGLTNLSGNVTRVVGNNVQQTVIPAYIIVSRKAEVEGDVICIESDDDDVPQQSLVQTQSCSTDCTVGYGGTSPAPTTSSWLPIQSCKQIDTEPSDLDPAISVTSSIQTSKDICNTGRVDTGLLSSTGSSEVTKNLCMSSEQTYTMSDVSSLQRKRGDTSTPSSLYKVLAALLAKNNSQDMTISQKEKRVFLGKCKVCVQKATGNQFGVPACQDCSVFFKCCVEDGIKINRHKDCLNGVGVFDCTCQLCHLLRCYIQGMEPQDSRSLVCGICNKPFLLSYFLNQHRKKCQKSPFSIICHNCLRSFPTKDQLNQHKKCLSFCGRADPSEEKWKFRCDICWQILPSLHMLILHRYTHSSIDEEMLELESSLEVQTSPNDGKAPVSVHKEMPVIKQEKGEDEHFNVDNKSQNAMADKKTLPEKQMASCTSNSTMQDLFVQEDQRLKIPKSEENQTGKTEKSHFDNTSSKVDSEESEIKVRSEDKSDESLSYLTSIYTVAENDQQRTTVKEENRAENNHKKTDLDEEMLTEESDLQKFCSTEEKGEESTEEAISDDDYNDDYFIIVNFESSDEEESGVNMKEDANSKEHEIQSRTDLKLENSNEMPDQCTKLELTPISEVCSSGDAIEPVEDTEKITAENNSIGNVITDVDNYSTKCDAEGISTERNGSFSENEDLKKVQLSIEMKNKGSDAQTVFGDQQVTAQHTQCTSKPKTDEILKRRNQITIQTLINQLGLKPVVKTITNEDGSERLEVHYVRDDKINLKELGIHGTSSSASLNTTIDEVSSTMSDDLECSTSKGISGQGTVSKEIQSPKNSENSASLSTEEVARPNVITTGKPTLGPEKQSEAAIFSVSKSADNIRKMLDQEEVGSENQKYIKDEEHATTSDLICLSSDEEQNASPPAASGINQAVEKQSCEDQSFEETTKMIDQTVVNSRNSLLQHISSKEHGLPRKQQFHDTVSISTLKKVTEALKKKSLKIQSFKETTKLSDQTVENSKNSLLHVSLQGHELPKKQELCAMISTPTLQKVTEAMVNQSYEDQASEETTKLIDETVVNSENPLNRHVSLQGHELRRKQQLHTTVPMSTPENITEAPENRSLKDQTSEETTELMDQMVVNAKNFLLEHVFSQGHGLPKNQELHATVSTSTLKKVFDFLISWQFGLSDSSTSQSHLQNPLNINNLDPEDVTYTCYICNKSFSTPELIKQHLRTVHSYYSKEPCDLLKGFFCCHCNREFTSLKGLSFHEKTVHGFNLSCPFCGIHLRNSNLLLKHIVNHLSPWVLCCFLCDQEFKQETEFKVHVALKHSGKMLVRAKRIKCCICNQFLAGVVKFCDHLAHVHGRLFKYACRVCFQRFCTLSALKVHRRSLGNTLYDSRVKIAKINSIDTSLLQEVPLSNQHHSPDSTPNKTQFTAEEKEQHSVVGNLDLTLTNERTISESVVSTTHQTGENEHQNFKNRQELPVNLTNCVTKKERVLNDLPSTSVACASEGLQETECPKQLKTSSINADQDCPYNNQSCSTLKNGGSKLPTVVGNNIDDISTRMLRSHKGKSSYSHGQNKSSGRKTQKSLQTNSHNITLTDGSFTVYPEKGENSQQFEKGQLIRNLMTVQPNKTQQKEDSVSLKRKSSPTVADSDNVGENVHIHTPQKQPRFEPDSISDLTEKTGNQFAGCSEVVQGLITKALKLR